ncbi:PH domain containing protein [Histomonas meleagridis]|uniref:PH domain containing protein n=1 Tax=Histomonas meleagridis TaxID=135588 RepID=UPI003559425C|nr:PH domain containing protein [Histomonas meleagridis]
MKKMSGIIKKKGRHAMQGYKDREFVVGEDGYFRYGPPGDKNKWVKKIKLSDISEIEPYNNPEIAHCFIITKRDGRILYFAAQTDQEKWNWITGFREAVLINVSPEWSPVNEVSFYNSHQKFIALLKLSKVTMTNIWRWRYFYIDEYEITYFADPTLGEKLGRFKISNVTNVKQITNKHGRDLLLQVDVKLPGKRSYFFSHPDTDALEEFYKIVNIERPKKKMKFW